MTILDNYMFQPLLAIFSLSSRELKVLQHTLCAHVMQRSLHTATNNEKQYTATTTVCATTHTDIHPPGGKTGARWEHTNTQSVS
jgi:hypothetical protein